MICEECGFFYDISRCFVSQDFTMLCLTRLLSSVVACQVQEVHHFSNSLLRMDLLNPFVSENTVYGISHGRASQVLYGHCVRMQLLVYMCFVDHVAGLQRNCMEFSTKLKPQSMEGVRRAILVAPMFFITVSSQIHLVQVCSASSPCAKWTVQSVLNADQWMY